MRTERVGCQYQHSVMRPSKVVSTTQQGMFQLEAPEATEDAKGVPAMYNNVKPQWLLVL